MHPGHDEGVMLSWFANSLMRGYDEHALRAADAARAVPDEAIDLLPMFGVAETLRAAGMKVVRDV